MVAFGELRTAAGKTLVDPRAEEEVALVDHELTSEHHPTYALWLDGSQVASLTLDVELTLTISGVVAVVRGGG